MSTDQLKDLITTLHGEGRTDAYISRQCQVNRQYIQQLRSGMGLAAKWGKDAPKFTKEIDAEILRLRDDKELRWTEIAKIVDRPAQKVAERYEFLDQRRIDESEIAPVVRGSKKCLKCRRVFDYTDRTKEWYCGPCRDQTSTYGNYMCVDVSRSSSPVGGAE